MLGDEERLVRNCANSCREHENGHARVGVHWWCQDHSQGEAARGDRVHGLHGVAPLVVCPVEVRDRESARLRDRCALHRDVGQYRWQRTKTKRMRRQQHQRPNVKEQLARLSGQSDKLTAMQQVLHCDLLDRSIFAAEVQKSIVAQSEALQAQVAAVWKADVDSLKAHLRGMCPKWESKRESLLTEDVLCKELLSNTANYAKIGPVADELRYWGKEFRKLHGDNAGVLLPLEWLKEIGSAADFGIETVAFTYVIAHVRNEFRKLQGNAVQLADSIQALKKKITEEHRVQLTPQMEEYFTDFIEGRRRGTEHEQEDPARASAFAPFTVQPQSPGRGSAPSDDTTVDEGSMATPRTKDSRDSSSTPRTSQGTPLPAPSQRASKRRRFGDSLKA